MTLILKAGWLRDPIYIADALAHLNEFSTAKLHGVSAQELIVKAARNLLAEYNDLLEECCDNCRQFADFVEDTRLCRECVDELGIAEAAMLDAAQDDRAHAAMDRRAGL